MVGQEKFFDKLKHYHTLPQSVILLGDEGAGHEQVCKEIQETYDLLYFDISELISTEYVNQIYLSTNPSLYFIDLNKTDYKQQNVLLKIFEEPSRNQYFYLAATSLDHILFTLSSRALVMKMDQYSSDYLSSLITTGNPSQILSVCTTPGQVRVANHTDMDQLFSLCDNIVNKISVANFQNTLTISNKINFQDDYNKFDLSLFLRVLSNRLVQNNNFKLFTELNKYIGNIQYMNDKKAYLDHILIKLWKAYR